MARRTFHTEKHPFRLRTNSHSPTWHPFGHKHPSECVFGLRCMMKDPRLSEWYVSLIEQTITGFFSSSGSKAQTKMLKKTPWDWGQSLGTPLPFAVEGWLLAFCQESVICHFVTVTRVSGKVYRSPGSPQVSETAYWRKSLFACVALVILGKNFVEMGYRIKDSTRVFPCLTNSLRKRCFMRNGDLPICFMTGKITLKECVNAWIIEIIKRDFPNPFPWQFLVLLCP